MEHDVIRNYVQSHVDRGTFSGVEWAINKSGRIWDRGSIGYTNALTKSPMPEKPIFRIYSMTKPIISVAALIMIERLKLRLYDPVSAFLPGFSDMKVLGENGNLQQAGGPILIEHLLTHTAGLSYGFLSECPVGRRYSELNVLDARHSLGEMVNIIADQPLAFDPGTDWKYSVATDVLAHVLEIISGKPIGDLLKDLIFDSLGMNDTGFFVPQTDRARIMEMYGTANLDHLFNPIPQPQTLQAADVSDIYPADDPTFARGGLGLFSTTDDYLKFAQFLQSGKAADSGEILSPVALKFGLQNRIPQSLMPLVIGPNPMPGYGYGLMGRVASDTGMVLSPTSAGEHGWAGAASTFFWVDPEEDVVGVVMTQFLGLFIPLGDDIRVAAYSDA